LKNLAQGTTEESLRKVLKDISIEPSKIFFVNFDKEVYALICFTDYQSLCDAAAIIDKSSTGDSPFKRGNNK